VTGRNYGGALHVSKGKGSTLLSHERGFVPIENFKFVIIGSAYTEKIALCAKASCRQKFRGESEHPADLTPKKGYLAVKG